MNKKILSIVILVVLIILASLYYLASKNNLGYRCGKYSNNNTVTEECSFCGNFICSKYEKCMPSTINCTNEAYPATGCYATADCGPIYCPLDCK